MNERERIQRYLAHDFTEPIRDPLWQHVYLSPELKRIVASPQFQKLGGIRQLGPTYMAYPGATHTRLNHSLGVFALAHRMIRTIASFDTAEGLTVRGVRSFLCAALLHDLGHFPFAHSLKELPVASHESLTAKIITDSPLRTLIDNETDIDPYMAAAIVDTDLDDAGDKEIRIYRKILSGVLDPDKLDYLTRDAYFCGVPYGVQDVDFIISKLGYHREAGLTIDEHGLHAIENVLFSKYSMYRTIYWHKTVRIATAMIKKALHSGMVEGSVQPEDLYGLDDAEFSRIFSGSNYRFAGLISAVSRRQLYRSTFERSFDESSSAHTALLDLDTRASAEKDLAGAAGIEAQDIIIDIPEKISFEVDLLLDIEGSLIPFMNAGTVFTNEVVSGFVKSLRKIRVFTNVDTEHERALARAADELLGMSRP